MKNLSHKYIDVLKLSSLSEESSPSEEKRELLVSLSTKTQEKLLKYLVCLLNMKTTSSHREGIMCL